MEKEKLSHQGMRNREARGAQVTVLNKVVGVDLSEKVASELT